VNEHPQLYVTDPTGIFFEYKATAIGEGEAEIKEFLDKNYRENLNVEDGIKLAVKALKKVLGKEFDINRIDGAYISSKDKKFVRVTRDRLSKVA
jgi:proteasome alpha subunit